MSSPAALLDHLSIPVLPSLRTDYRSEIEKSVETIRASAFEMGKQSGISLGIAIAQYAQTKGITPQEARRELNV